MSLVLKALDAALVDGAVLVKRCGSRSGLDLLLIWTDSSQWFLDIIARTSKVLEHRHTSAPTLRSDRTLLCPIQCLNGCTPALYVRGMVKMDVTIVITKKLQPSPLSPVQLLLVKDMLSILLDVASVTTFIACSYLLILVVVGGIDPTNALLYVRSLIHQVVGSIVIASVQEFWVLAVHGLFHECYLGSPTDAIVKAFSVLR
ncbi:hypothetical protein Tco_0525772 [Tanacetum coccineum]